MTKTEEKQIEELQKQLLDITVPILDIAERISMVPLVGMLDSTKSQTLMQNILEHIKNKDVKVIIIDILGIVTVDSAVAAHIIKLTKATKLLGCTTIISGISPQVAQIVVNLGINLSEVKTDSDLKNSIVTAYDMLGLELVKK